MAETRRITVDEVKQRMAAGEKFTIIDVRNPQAWAESDAKIQGAIRVPIDEWEEALSAIPKGHPIVTYCT